MAETPMLVNGAVRATCSQCGHKEERQVPLGRSIAREYDRLLIWMRDEHECEGGGQHGED